MLYIQLRRKFRWLDFSSAKSNSCWMFERILHQIDSLASYSSHNLFCSVRTQMSRLHSKVRRLQNSGVSGQSSEISLHFWSLSMPAHCVDFKRSKSIYPSQWIPTLHTSDFHVLHIKCGNLALCVFRSDWFCIWRDNKAQTDFSRQCRRLPSRLSIFTT